MEPFRFIQDESSHWYWIPVRLTDKFEEWQEAGWNSDLARFREYDFESYRIDGGPMHYQFTQTLRPIEY